jgi:transposase
MLRVNVARWGQSAEDLRDLALLAAHPRTRERYLALYEISQDSNATVVAERHGRDPQTVMRWVHRYNANGPEGLEYRRTGGRRPFVRRSSRRSMGGFGRRWPQRPGHRRRARRPRLHRLKLSWKKAKKLLRRAAPKKRAEFITRIRDLLKGALFGHHQLVYWDEAHVHQDADLGYGWSVRGERRWVCSNSPGLSARVSFYGVYLYNEGQAEIWPYPRANSDYTQEVLDRLRQRYPTETIKLLWDGAPYPRAQRVAEHAAHLNIDLIPLPAYSPGFMPVEALWRWLREDVTYGYCRASPEELIERVEAFRRRINTDPWAVADHLWVKNPLDPEEENLRISK